VLNLDECSRQRACEASRTFRVRPNRWCRSRGASRHFQSFAALVLLGVLIAGCQGGSTTPAGAAPKAAAKPAAPSKVVGGVKEADLAKVELTEDAEKRLGILPGGLIAVERKPIGSAVSYPGEVMIPSGHLISVTSPFAATLKAPRGAMVPQPGAIVALGQTIFLTEPNLSPGERATLASVRVDVEAQVKSAQEQLNIAKINMDRQENLVRDKLAGQAALVDAKAQYSAAQTTLRAIDERRDAIVKMAAGGTEPQPANAPVKGVLQNLHAQVDQQVAAGAILFDVAEMDPLWVKVSVYVGDLERLAIDRPAGVGGLADAPGVKVRVAQPVTAPPTGDPLAATIHLYYQVENRDQLLRPGQRVGVTLPLKGSEMSLVVPRSSLVRDAHGGSWVYVGVAPHTYARERVFVDRVVGDLAALLRGPKVGAKVVSQGAAELYGAEFGGLK
jgi:cobalt-zinc-cadmium efflux system membrane fusion protein